MNQAKLEKEWRCNKDCKITREIFTKLLEEQMTEFRKKFPYYSTFFKRISINSYFKDMEPIKQNLFAVNYPMRDLEHPESAVIKIFKYSVCNFHKHEITELMKGQLFNLILHESLHSFFGEDEETVSKITKVIGKEELWLNNKGQRINREGKLIK